jgi:hypothetical protein
MSRKSRDQQTYEKLCTDVGLDAVVDGVAATMRRYRKPRGFVRYWREKALDANFHSGELGGAHNTRFSEDGQLAAEHALWTLVQADSRRTAASYARSLKSQGLPVDYR